MLFSFCLGGRQRLLGERPKKRMNPKYFQELEKAGSSWCHFLDMSNFTAKVPLSTMQLASQDSHRSWLRDRKENFLNSL
jgi:hypothetical protein